MPATTTWSVANTCGTVTSGTATLTINTPSAPPIAPQPTSQTVCEHQTATFALGASNASSYRWRKNGVNLSNGSTGHGSTYSGATTSALQINNASTADAVSDSFGFDCVVSNACGFSATSSRVGLTVNPLPTAVVSGSATNCGGGPVTIQAALTGTGPWTVTWSDGVTSNNITANPVARTVSPASTTTYKVTAISDSKCTGGTSTGSATITVLSVTAVVSGSAKTCPGGSATIKAVLTGTSPWTVTWSDGVTQNDVPASL